MNTYAFANKNFHLWFLWVLCMNSFFFFFWSRNFWCFISDQQNTKNSCLPRSVPHMFELFTKVKKPQSRQLQCQWVDREHDICYFWWKSHICKNLKLITGERRWSGRVQRTDVETSFKGLPVDLNKILSSSTILSPQFVLEILPLRTGSSGSVLSSPGRWCLGRENRVHDRLGLWTRRRLMFGAG